MLMKSDVTTCVTVCIRQLQFSAPSPSQPSLVASSSLVTSDIDVHVIGIRSFCLRLRLPGLFCA